MSISRVMVVAPILGWAAGVNCGLATKAFTEGSAQQGIGSSLIAAAAGTAAVGQFQPGGVRAALAGVAALTALVGVGVKLSG